MTKSEEQEIIRVHGKDYKWGDIPTYIRKRDEKKVQNYQGNVFAKIGEAFGMPPQDIKKYNPFG